MAMLMLMFWFVCVKLSLPSVCRVGRRLVSVVLRALIAEGRSRLVADRGVLFGSFVVVLERLEVLCAKALRRFRRPQARETAPLRASEKGIGPAQGGKETPQQHRASRFGFHSTAATKKRMTKQNPSS